MTYLIYFFTAILVLASLLMVMIILMQRPRSDSGLGAALGGGGAAESAFGAETGNILSRGTIYCAIFFFVVSFSLYLGHMHLSHQPPAGIRALPEMRGVGEPAPAEVPLVSAEELLPAEEVPDEGVPPAPLD